MVAVPERLARAERRRRMRSIAVKVIPASRRRNLQVAGRLREASVKSVRTDVEHGDIARNHLPAGKVEAIAMQDVQ